MLLTPKTKYILPVLLLAIGVCWLNAQELEKWLFSPPNGTPELNPDKIGGKMPKGTVFRWFFIGTSSRLKNFCDEFWRDQLPPFESTKLTTVPQLSELNELTQSLLEAAILASDSLDTETASGPDQLESSTNASSSLQVQNDKN